MTIGKSSSKALKVAVVGFGNQGAEHVDALRRSRLPLRLAAIVDPAGIPEGLELPEGCSVHATITELPATVDAVIVATPPMTYQHLVPELLAGRRHVLLEKPLGTDLAQALHFVELAQAADRVLMPAVQRRFHPTYQAWREWRPEAGRLREALIYMTIRHRGEAWRASRAEAGGGALFDLGFHAIDLAQQLFGDLRLRVACFFDEAGRPCHDGFDFQADLLLHSESDVAVRLHVARGAAEKEERVVVRGDAGTLEIERGRIHFLPDGPGRVKGAKFDPTWRLAMEAQMTVWLDSMKPGASVGKSEKSVAPDSPAWHGASAMRMMEEAYAQGRF